MAGVQANWHVELLDGAVEDDPFEEMTRVEDVGKPIDLSTGVPFLHDRLGELVREEGSLFAAGVTCAVKDSRDASCSACPIRSDDPFDPRSALCAVGVQQERVLTLLTIHAKRPDALPAAQAKDPG